MEIIRLQEVSFSYSTAHQRIDLFEALNLSFKSGEITALWGPSGSGKTTLLNIIAGFLKLKTGNVIFNSNNISEFSEGELCTYRNKNIGFVFQFFNLIQQLTVEENIAVPLMLSGVKTADWKERVGELIQKVGLDRRGRHYPYQLSGGEQQRVAIARALANNPRIILADEPTGNLDKKNRSAIVTLINEMRDEGRAIIIASHDEQFARIADKVVDLEQLSG
jgi:putative ABC transport system ATP-binding protein